MHPRMYKEGQSFGDLTIINAYTEKQGQRWKHLVRCECGTEKQVCGDDMKKGNISSCGCKRWGGTHGMSQSPEYKVWSAMIQRCTNPNDKGYKNYGARGVGVDGEWLGFESFMLDMGARPTKHHSLERVDNELGYSNKNCKWASRSTQSINQRVRADNKTGCKGVSFCNSKKAYIAKIKRNKKREKLG